MDYDEANTHLGQGVQACLAEEGAHISCQPSFLLGQKLRKHRDYIDRFPNEAYEIV